MFGCGAPFLFLVVAPLFFFLVVAPPFFFGMLPLRSNVHLNNAKLETCGILELFLGSWCRMHFGTTALGFSKHLGKFSVVVWNGFAAKLQPLDFPNPSTVLTKG